MHKLTDEQMREIIGAATAADVLKSTKVAAGADVTAFVVRKNVPKLIECADVQEAREYEANWPGEVLTDDQIANRLGHHADRLPGSQPEQVPPVVVDVQHDQADKVPPHTA